VAGIASFWIYIVLWLTNCAVVPGRVPKELANLINLTELYLHPDNIDLQVPDGAPTTSHPYVLCPIGMWYTNRGQVAAFQACLK